MDTKAEEVAQRKTRNRLAGAIHDRVSVLKGEGSNGTEVVAIEFISHGGNTWVILSAQAASELHWQLTELTPNRKASNGEDADYRESCERADRA
jgi:predicted aspartyl protease